MIWSDYWGALSTNQRISLIAGAVLIAAVAIGMAMWLLRDAHVPLASSLSSDRLNELTQELDRAKLDYRVSESADAVTVPQSQLGKARAATASGQFGAPPSVGLELFKETDFSSTDFAQRINYQRALQGELTRTILSIAGVRSARVHVILADGGLFKRDAARASAAVSLALQPGKQLTASQVRGIQRLVAASVPQIKVDDVVVLDESGATLTRAGSEVEGELSSAQLDLKRGADQYLESKLMRLLQELVPAGTASVSVDTTLDERQLRVTTDEPIPGHAGKSGEHAAGVLVKERQSQRGGAAGLVQASDYADNTDGADWEYEYVVGHRVVQALSAPGSIKRVSVAVALQGVPQELSAAAVEQLIASAVGIDRSRGDSVAVLLLPGSHASATAEQVVGDAADASLPLPFASAVEPHSGAKNKQPFTFRGSTVALVIGLAGLLALLGALWRIKRREDRDANPSSDAQIEAIAAKVRQWLNEEADNEPA